MYTNINDIPQIVHSLRSTFQKGIHPSIHRNEPFLLIYAFLLGTTKSIEYRKQQLLGLQRFLTEQREEIINSIRKDLNKHAVETVIAEIAPVAGELEYMLNVMKIHQDFLLSTNANL